MLAWWVLRHAKGKLVHVRSTALNTLTTDESRQRPTAVAREVPPATAESLAHRADVGTGRARAIDLKAADPASHPEVWRQPSRLPRQQVGKVGTAIACAKHDPWRAANGACLLMHQEHLVRTVAEDGSPASVGERVQANLRGYARRPLLGYGRHLGEEPSHERG